MAVAKKFNGTPYTWQADGKTAVDPDGKVLFVNTEDGPKGPDGNDLESDGEDEVPEREPNTSPKLQPGAVGAPTQMEQMGLMIARGLQAGVGSIPGATATLAPPAESVKLPILADLPDVLAGMKTVGEVKAMWAHDDRVGATPLYLARLAELG